MPARTIKTWCASCIKSNDPLFRKARGAESGELTSTSVFDMFTLDDDVSPTGDAGPEELHQLREQFRLDAQAGRTVPLYFVQFVRPRP